MNNPLISVIIPAYNAEAFIAETIDSVRKQTYSNIEIIVVDNGSTDKTAEITKKFSSVIYLYQEQKGVCAARNHGITQAHGDYIALVDADDLWEPTKLEKQMQLFIKQPELGMVYCDVWIWEFQKDRKIRLGEKMHFPYGHIAEQLFISPFIPSPTPLIPKKVFSHVGLFDTNFYIAEDWEMWLRIAEKYPIGFVSAPLALYRVHETNVSKLTKTEKQHEQRVRVIEKLCGLSPLYNALKTQALFSCHKTTGQMLLRDGQSTLARTHLYQALGHKKTDLKAWFLLLLSFIPEKIMARLITIRRHF